MMSGSWNMRIDLSFQFFSIWIQTPRSGANVMMSLAWASLVWKGMFFSSRHFFSISGSMSVDSLSVGDQWTCPEHETFTQLASQRFLLS